MRPRARCLTALGLLYAFLGLGYLSDLPTATQRGISFQVALLPVHVWAVAFLLVGVLAFASASWVRAQPVAFGAAQTLAVFWSLGGFGSWLTGAPRAWVLGVLFAALAVLVSGIADSRDPVG